MSALSVSIAQKVKVMTEDTNNINSISTSIITSSNINYCNYCNMWLALVRSYANSRVTLNRELVNINNI